MAYYTTRIVQNNLLHENKIFFKIRFRPVTTFYTTRIVQKKNVVKLFSFKEFKKICINIDVVPLY